MSKQPDITLTFSREEEDDFDLEAHLGALRVGYAWGLKKGDRLLLADIRVLESIPQRRSILARILRRKPVETSFRRRGIGTRILRRFLQEADAAGVREIWGSISARDLGDWPELLRWYERHGFVIEEPDDGCVKGAAKKILRRVRP